MIAWTFYLDEILLTRVIFIPVIMIAWTFYLDEILLTRDYLISTTGVMKKIIKIFKLP